jgi:hypothetical protein
VSKLTAFNLALFSAVLGVWFGYEREYVCFGAALLLVLVFDGIWAHKVHRDYRLSQRHSPLEPETPITKTSLESKRLVLPRSPE